MKPVKCTCADWMPGVSKINAYIDVGRIHSMGDYSGKPFVYCPWCGLKLMLEEDRDNWEKYLQRETKRVVKEEVVIKIPAKPMNMGKAVRDIREAKIKGTIVCDFCHKEVERKSVSSQFRNSGFHGKTRFAGYACPVCVEKQAAFWKRRSRKACK